MSTFMACDNMQAQEAEKMLGDRTWDDGITLGFELISTKDAKV